MSDLKVTMGRIYEEIFNQGNDEAVDDLLADDFVEHEELPSGVPLGKESPRAMTIMMRSAFPDFHATVEEMLQDGSKVVARARFSGTHMGEFMGIPPTGATFDIPVIDIVEFRDGKAVGHWGIMDVAGMVQQLGLGGQHA